MGRNNKVRKFAAMKRMIKAKDNRLKGTDKKKQRRFLLVITCYAETGLDLLLVQIREFVSAREFVYFMNNINQYDFSTTEEKKRRWKNYRTSLTKSVNSLIFQIQ